MFLFPSLLKPNFSVHQKKNLVLLDFMLLYSVMITVNNFFYILVSFRSAGYGATL